MTHGAQDITATDSPYTNPDQSLTPPVVMGELIDSSPENSHDKDKRRKRRLSCGILLVVLLLVVTILVVSLPLALRSKDDADGGSQEPLPVPTGLHRTFAPSLTPGPSSFVKFGRDIEEEERYTDYGYSVAFAGERWVAVGAPLTENGIVLVFDLYNRTQTCQYMEAKDSNYASFGEALSGTKDFLAVASWYSVDLFRYNETARQWGRIVPMLDPRDFTSINGPLRLNWRIEALSMNQLLLSGNRTLVHLTVTFWSIIDAVVVLALFTIDLSQPTPVWAMMGHTLVFEDAVMAEGALVGDDALVVGVVSSPGQSVTATRAYLLQGNVWIQQMNFKVPQSVSSTSRLLSTSFFHSTNSTVVAFAYEADSSGTPPTIDVVEVGPDLSVVPKGSPIRYISDATSDWTRTRVVIHGEWLVWGSSHLNEVAGGVYRFEDGDWIKQGNNLRVRVPVDPLDGISLALSASSLVAKVESPTVVMGFPTHQSPIAGFARLFRARGELS